MRKVALVFVAAVIVPSLVLAWLAVRSLRDQQFLLERQQSLLYQRVTDALAKNISDRLSQQQQEFGAQVESLVASNNARAIAVQFDNQLRQRWPLAEIGFCVTLAGPTTCTITCPTPAAGPEAQRFLVDNGAFLGNQAIAEVYWNANNGKPALQNSGAGQTQQPQQKIQSSADTPLVGPNNFKSKSQARAVNPQNQAPAGQYPAAVDENLSKIMPAEAEFRQLIGSDTDGMLARFLQNKLKLMFWHRLDREPDLIFGAQVNLNRLINDLRPLVLPGQELRDEIWVMLLDDNAKPVAGPDNPTPPGVRVDWKHPFVATEVGEALPHWEVAAYLRNPSQLPRAAHTAKLTLGLLIAVLVLAIGVGSWLIVASLGAELKLARQKTDFVSNVSHELKTPLTSIRMFSELLAEGRVTEPAKQKSYLQIITAEAARLTRLINNVLDFSRLESGEKKYNFQPCDLAEVARNAAQTFRPHLEAGGFEFDCSFPGVPIPVRGDADALSQIIVNLLSNAEKYSNGSASPPSPRPSGERAGERGTDLETRDLARDSFAEGAGGEAQKENSICRKEISMQVIRKEIPLPCAEIKVLDRGTGVPGDCSEKIFEKFYRAHDSLSSGIQGSGLGLTIARQIARAHGGDVVYEARSGGGSCFSLRLPIKPA